MSDTTSQRQKLNEITAQLKLNQDLNKRYFGLLFWQLSAVANQLSLSEIASQPSTLAMTEGDDEALAALVGIYLQIWDSANDFHAASRFLASTLEMTADELIQSKMIFESGQA
ncbi:MAG: hypothetical protein HRU19_02355 [Pseudobacteriovorax sp.]|nr:hypothetical protein [Pseudobacteriovorax sp.]